MEHFDTLLENHLHSMEISKCMTNNYQVEDLATSPPVQYSALLYVTCLEVQFQFSYITSQCSATNKPPCRVSKFAFAKLQICHNIECSATEFSYKKYLVYNKVWSTPLKHFKIQQIVVIKSGEWRYYRTTHIGMSFIAMQSIISQCY